MKVRRIDYSPDEFLVGTQGMPDAICTVYWKACTLMYSRGGPVEVDEVRKWCTSRRDVFDRAIEYLITHAKLSLDGVLLSNSRASAELLRATNRASTWRLNGAKGGRPSNNNNGLEKPSGFSEKNPTENRASNYQPSTIKEGSTDVDPPPPVDPPQEKKHVGRGTRLPQDWQPGPEDIAFAQQLGLDAGAVADEFCDYWRAVPGAKGLKLDWHATFRNSCRRVAGNQGGAGNQRSRSGRQEPPSILAAARRAMLAGAPKGLG